MFKLYGYFIKVYSTLHVYTLCSGPKFQLQKKKKSSKITKKNVTNYMRVEKGIKRAI